MMDRTSSGSPSAMATPTSIDSMPKGNLKNPINIPSSSTSTRARSSAVSAVGTSAAARSAGRCARIRMHWRSWASSSCSSTISARRSAPRRSRTITGATWRQRSAGPHRGGQAARRAIPVHGSGAVRHLRPFRRRLGIHRRDSPLPGLLQVAVSTSGNRRRRALAHRQSRQSYVPCHAAYAEKYVMREPAEAGRDYIGPVR